MMAADWAIPIGILSILMAYYDGNKKLMLCVKVIWRKEIMPLFDKPLLNGQFMGEIKSGNFIKIAF